MRLGIFGGSFDPVHLAHLLLADCCAVQAALDQVWFVPTAHQPLKPAGPVASDDHRVAMLRLVCDQRSMFRVHTLELQRGGVSYTVDTLKAIAKELPDAQLFFLMGADSLADIPNWYQPAEICRLATPLVVQRAGSDEPDFSVLSSVVQPDRLREIEQSRVEMPPTAISSSQIRESIATGQAWQELVPTEVADYLEQHQLYASQR